MSKRTLGISLPAELYDHIKLRAKDNCRSFSQELQFLLEAALGAELDQQLETLRAMNRLERMIRGGAA